MAEAVCTGCGSELEDGRSVCASCGRLNRPAPEAPAAPPAFGGAAPPQQPPGWTPPAPQQPSGWTPPAPPQQPQQPPGWAAPPPQQGAYGARPPGPYGAPQQGYYGAPVAPGAWAPTPTPAGRRKGSRGRSPVVIVLSVLLGIGAYFVARNVTTDVLSSGSDETSSTSAPDLPDSFTTGNGESGTTLPAGPEPGAPEKRYPVTKGNVTWTMRSDADEDALDVPIPGGGTLHGTVLWAADGEDAADLAIIYDLEGRPFDLEAGIRGAVQGNSGEILEGPSPITIGGREGLMVTGTFERGGLSGTVHWGGVQIDDRVYVLGSVTEGSNRTAGEQAFADLIASVQVS